jgi:hypothetical protein
MSRDEKQNYYIIILGENVKNCDCGRHFFLFKIHSTLVDDVFEVPTKGHLLLSLVCHENSVLVRSNNMKESDCGASYCYTLDTFILQ